MDDIFPNAGRWDIKVTSPATSEYNCVAWAAFSQVYAIWPDADEQMAWPPSLPRSESVSCMAAFFNLMGFVKSDSDAPEPGALKIAIYAKDDNVTHIARLLDSGEWTSKLGPEADIQHRNLRCIANSIYGTVAMVMKRQMDGRPLTLPPLHPPRPLIFIP